MRMWDGVARGRESEGAEGTLEKGEGGRRERERERGEEQRERGGVKIRSWQVPHRGVARPPNRGIEKKAAEWVAWRVIFAPRAHHSQTQRT